jgi:F0F1-type ATP synthase assembly protein I
MARGVLIIIAGALVLILLGYLLERTVAPGALLVIGPVVVLGAGLATMYWKRRVQRREAAAKKS